MKQFILALGLWSCILSTSASTLEITYSDISPFSGAVVGGESLLLRGEIAPGDYERLLQVIRRDQHRFWRSAGFVLASPGGDIQEALRIARLVKGTYSTVFVGATFGPCISACFFIYSAAARREAGVGTLGIHRPYIDAHRLASMSASEAERLQRLVFKQVALIWKIKTYRRT